jgi:hypothetical protein
MYLPKQADCHHEAKLLYSHEGKWICERCFDEVLKEEKRGAKRRGKIKA